jgi:hypothetical protein
MQALIWLSFGLYQLARIVTELPLEQDAALVETILFHAVFWCWCLKLTRLQELTQFSMSHLRFWGRLLLQIFANLSKLDYMHINLLFACIYFRI